MKEVDYHIEIDFHKYRIHATDEGVVLLVARQRGRREVPLVPTSRRSVFLVTQAMLQHKVKLRVR